MARRKVQAAVGAAAGAAEVAAGRRGEATAALEGAKGRQMQLNMAAQQHELQVSTPSVTFSVTPPIQVRTLQRAVEEAELQGADRTAHMAALAAQHATRSKRELATEMVCTLSPHTIGPRWVRPVGICPLPSSDWSAR